MLAADSSSTIRLPRRLPQYQSPSMSEMPGQHFGQHVLVAGDDIDNPAGQVRGVHYLVEIRGQQSIMPRRDDDHAVAHGNSGQHG